MKQIVGIDQEIGGDGAKLNAQLGVEASNLKLELSVTYPLEQVLTPVNTVIDNLIDKVEALIPGDQKALAEGLKTDAKAQLVKLLSEQAPA